ncbi:MAG: alkaline phosphatase PhoX [Bacteroidota bacterium]
MRNEWVAIDPVTGIVYWTETGRDSGSSGPGIVFPAVADATNAVIAPHHTALAQSRGFADARDAAYQDYYGRVLYYDPATEEVGVAIDGGPYYPNGVTEADYPEKHLTNPDGLNILTVGGKSFLMIQEDLNGTSFGRMPDGVSNRLCELYLLAAEDAKDASVDDLVRVTAIPAGAEITGAIQIDDNTILVNSQHPSANNPFPYNHSLTLAVHGFANVTTDITDTPGIIQSAPLNVYPNPTTRQVFLSKTTDFAIYDMYGKRLKVYRNTNQADVSGFAAGTYVIVTAENESFKIVVETK